jgi:hypothetical protein
MPPHDAAALHSRWTEHRLSGDSPQRRQQVAAWGEESGRQMREAHGPEAAALVGQAQSLVRGRPTLAKVLDGGLGSHPEVTRILVDVVKRGAARIYEQQSTR